jgi:hypothetical protein
MKISTGVSLDISAFSALCEGLVMFRNITKTFPTEGNVKVSQNLSTIP